MKKIILILAVFLLSITAVLAQESHDTEIEEGRKLVENNTNCDNLSDEQLEAIGEYYMEQMHPGELHKRMDEMMGGEGSDSLKQVHINMAKTFYCGDSNAMPMGMMNFVMGRSSYNGMMRYGDYGGMMQGRNYYNSSNNYLSVTNILLNILLIVLIVLAVVWILKISQKRR